MNSNSAPIPKPVKTGADTDMKAWAHRLRIREQQCEKLTAAVRQMWRDALKTKDGK